MLDAIEFHLMAVLDDAAELVGPPARELPIDRYVAASLMQKAIRRGEVEWASDGAFTLLQMDSRYLWRRLIITLFEDVGLHDARLAWRVLASRQHCLKLGTEAWPIVQLIVSEMATSPKSQAGNHALHLASADAGKARAVDLLVDRPLAEAIRWITDSPRPLPELVHAIWTLSGMKLGGIASPIQHPEASGAAGWAAFDRIVSDGEIRALARAGAQAGASILAVSTALAAPVGYIGLNGYPSVPDAMPPASLIGGVPSWAFDMYTRVGKQALALASKTCSNVRAVLQRDNVPAPKRANVLGSVHFELESASLQARLQHPTDLPLLSRVRTHAAGPWARRSSEIFEALQSDWDKFQSLRTMCSHVRAR